MTTRAVWNTGHEAEVGQKRTTCLVVRNWQDNCDICGRDVGEDQLVCDEYGIATCSDCEPEAGE